MSDHIGTIADCVALVTNLADSASRSSDARPMLEKPINADVDFDSAIQAKLIAKRLGSAVKDMQRESSSDRSDEIIQALAPFHPCGSEFDGEESQKGDQIFTNSDQARGVHTRAFDPLAPKLICMDGTLASKIALVWKILMADIGPSIIKAGEGGLGGQRGAPADR